MISIFTIPKAFKGHFSVIQRNAIQSWKLLGKDIEIIVMGDEEGTAEIAFEFGVQHLPDVARNEFGTPLLNDIFAKAEAAAANNLICYVNADIILTRDFLNPVDALSSRFDQFLGIGRRWDLDFTETIDFSNESWERELLQVNHVKGQLHSHYGIDYFLFRKGLYGNIPQFAIGRTAWDAWLVYMARKMRIPVIDLTSRVTVIHQNHDYSHHPKGFEGVWQGEETRKNWDLAGGPAYFFKIGDADWIFDENSNLKRNYTMNFLLRKLETLPAMLPLSQDSSIISRGLYFLSIQISRAVKFLRTYNQKKVQGCPNPHT